MKKAFIIFQILFAGFAAKAQTNEVIEKITKKMTDSLSLTTSEKQGILEINTNIHLAKMEVRKQHSQVDSIAKYSQRIENTRDSLYRVILQDAKYQIYLQKKKNLISVQ